MCWLSGPRYCHQFSSWVQCVKPHHDMAGLHSQWHFVCCCLHTAPGGLFNKCDSRFGCLKKFSRMGSCRRRKLTFQCLKYGAFVPTQQITDLMFPYIYIQDEKYQGPQNQRACSTLLTRLSFWRHHYNKEMTKSTIGKGISTLYFHNVWDFSVFQGSLTRLYLKDRYQGRAVNTYWYMLLKRSLKNTKFFFHFTIVDMPWYDRLTSYRYMKKLGVYLK